MSAFVVLRQKIASLERWERERLAHSSVSFAVLVVESSILQWVTMAVLMANLVVVSQEAQDLTMYPGFRTSSVYTFFDLIFISYYLAEFIVKIYAAPVHFWYDPYNLFDAFVLVLAYVQRGVEIAYPNPTNMTSLQVLRGLRVIRAFRAISFIRGLQVVVNALLRTLRRNVLDILILLLLVMFVFGILGHYLFGLDASKSAFDDWGTLGSSIYTLFIYVCADGWWEYQQTLISDGYVGSQAFTAVFIFIGNFIIANLFVGVICQNIDDATRADRLERLQKMKDAKLLKRELFIRRQRKDILSLLSQVQLVP
ncbi:Cation channel sperm-associated protein 3 [Cladochytrium tenue]|nr:Cation channel sperm-associated protein 3 [Cladochytrium tenue]